jgi:hypothetical protein
VVETGSLMSTYTNSVTMDATTTMGKSNRKRHNLFVTPGRPAGVSTYFRYMNGQYLFLYLESTYWRVGEW